MVEKLICLHNEIQLVTKINTFFIVFHFDDNEHGLKIKKENSFQILVHIRICNFFLSISFFFFSLRPFCISVRVCTDREGRVHPPVYPSVHLFIPVSGPAVSGACLLPVPVSCFLLPVSVSGRGHSRKREQYAGQAGTVIWLCTHSWSVHGFQQQHYFRRSSTHTWERGEKSSVSVLHIDLFQNKS